MAINAATISSDEIYVGQSTNAVLTDYLDDLETEVGGKAAANHTHSDLESAIEDLEDGKAEAVHTHEMSAINGLNAALAAMNEAITAIQNSGGSAGVTPMLVASMHLGKLDNNSGAENSSSTRICSDPFAVAPGNSYYQVNDKGVNMYVLLYDADELFVEYMGSFASGAEIPVTNANAAYMRIGSLLGEYDLTNEFRIYDVDPESGESSGDAVDAYTKEEADARFAASAHTHDGYAASGHSHSEYAPASHGHSGYASSGHNHTPTEVGAVPATGGTFTGNVTVSPYLYTAQIQPKDAGSYSIGTADNRYYSTYLRANPNVSSDKRLKRDITALDAGTLAEFVNALPVVAYNYNDDAEDEAQRIGVIAQDVISADPAIAAFFVEVSEKGFFSLRPADFVFPLIAAVQELARKVTILEGK